jgi:hypothetical protein
MTPPNTPHVHRRTAMNGKGVTNHPGSTVVLILVALLVIAIAQSFCTYHSAAYFFIR